MTFTASFDDVTHAAEEGEELYASRYQKDCERDFPGYFAAIDINTGKLHVAEFSELAFRKAQEANPDCVVHIVQIGAPSAVSMSYLFAC
jgi:hypothetical protein